MTFPFILDQPVVKMSEAGGKRKLNAIEELIQQRDDKKKDKKKLPPLPEDEEIAKALDVSPEEAKRIAHLPQDIIVNGTARKNPEWLNSRRPLGIARFTGSIFGALMGYSPYTKPEKAIDELIESNFRGNFFTRWGQDHEDIACDAFSDIMKEEMPENEIKINHYGLIIDPVNPFLAYSPDGEVEIKAPDGTVTKYLLEIKCPGAKRKYPRQDEPLYGLNDWPNGKSGPCPTHYWFQIQLGCYIMNLTMCYFVIWTPQQCQVHKIYYDKQFMECTCIPKAKEMYWKDFIPTLRSFRLNPPEPKKPKNYEEDELFRD